MHTAVLAAIATLWGALTGALLPRPAHRFTTPQGEPWRTACPSGHPYAGPEAARDGGGDGDGGEDDDGGGDGDGGGGDGVRGGGLVRGWLGPAPCPRCTGDERRLGPSRVRLALVTAALCAPPAAATGPRPELAVWLLLTPVGVLLATVDARVKRLPDPLTLPLALLVPALLGLAALVPGHAGAWTGAVYGALALGAGFLALFLINPAGLGFGDVKLALVLGAALGWYGWSVLLLGVFAGFLSGSLYAVALLAARKATRRTAVPLGPFLLAGAYTALLAGAWTA